jgi:Bacterial regulatory protein, Fis family
MSAQPKSERIAPEIIAAAYERNGGNVRATAKELGIGRWTVTRNVRAQGKTKEKPIASGSVTGIEAEIAGLPEAGQIKRYILTSAQNNTHVYDAAWQNLLALAEFYNAEILVGTYSYNQNAYGKLSVKRGKDKLQEKELWYDPKLTPYLNDERKQLAKGLVWCGEYNALPTVVNPLAGLESYSGRQSAIFPHAKLAMRSIATMQDAGTKLNFTTGTVTQKNYIQKRAGTIAEFHHVYGALLVEVDADGHWWVRQLNADTDTGTIQDLDVVVTNGVVTTGHRVEAITWGDLHATIADEQVVKASLNMLDVLRPRYQFMHDVLEGSSINHHVKDNQHFKFWNWLRGLHRVEEEFRHTAELMNKYERPGTETIVVDSNHDDPWIQRWLRDHDYRKDPPNAEFYIEAQKYLYEQIRSGKMPRDINMTGWALNRYGLTLNPTFLISDESFLLCGDKIECGMHGHLGPNGRYGSPENLSKMGRRSNIAHTHYAGIYDGLYVAGTSTKFRWDYNLGPSNWTNSHIVTYPTGKRTIITMYAGKWRA